MKPWVVVAGAGAVTVVVVGAVAIAACASGPERRKDPSPLASTDASAAGGVPEGAERGDPARLGEPVPPSRSPVGTNLDGLSDWSTEWSLVDAFRVSRPWISSTNEVWDDGRPLDLDPRGNVRSLLPGQIARTLMMWDGVGAPPGEYVVLYEGEGRLDFRLPGGGPLQPPAVRRGEGRDVLTLDPREQGLVLDIVETKPENPLRNLRVLMPGGRCEENAARYCDASRGCPAGACIPFEQNHETQPFHPIFLERSAQYAAVRFMNWGQTNGSTQRRWQDRPTLDDVRWGEKGAPVEVMVALANQLGQDAWFTLPHLADDAYVERFATYVRDHLQPELRVYVEHSNEVWNDIFAQAAYAREQGLKAGLSQDPYEAQLRWHARRSTQIFQIFERVFGGTDRLVRVLGAHAANPWGAEVMLKFEDTAKHTDALGIAPYFGGEYGDPDPERLSRVRRMSVDDLFEDLRKQSLPEVDKMLKAQAALAKKFDVALVAYEGGQHLVGVGPAVDDDRLNALFDAANRDPRMRALYLDHLARWKAHGGGLFVHYKSGSKWMKWGRWGALEVLDQPREDAPKYDALQTFIETTPRWW